MAFVWLFYTVLCSYVKCCASVEWGDIERERERGTGRSGHGRLPRVAITGPCTVQRTSVWAAEQARKGASSILRRF